MTVHLEPTEQQLRRAERAVAVVERELARVLDALAEAEDRRAREQLGAEAAALYGRLIEINAKAFRGELESYPSLVRSSAAHTPRPANDR